MFYITRPAHDIYNKASSCYDSLCVLIPYSHTFLMMVTPLHMYLYIKLADMMNESVQ